MIYNAICLGSLPLPFFSSLTNGVASEASVSASVGQARQEPVYQ